jgi:hypothetical protein
MWRFGDYGRAAVGSDIRAAAMDVRIKNSKRREFS